MSTVIMIKSVFLVIAIFGYTYAAEYMAVKEPYIQSCKIRDPEFVACSTQSIQKLFKKLVTGLDGLDTIKTIDPMKLNKIKILQGDGPVSINSTLTKAIVTGFGNTEVIESRVSAEDYHWETKIRLPKMRIEGNYHMQGRILVIPLNGHGKCWFEASNMDIVLYTTTHLYDKFGHTFYNVTAVDVDYTLQGLKLKLDNLFDGVKALEDSTNAYLNENWRPVSEALKHIIVKTIEEILLDILNKIFHYIPAEYLVSDIPTSAELYG